MAIGDIKVSINGDASGAKRAFAETKGAAAGLQDALQAVAGVFAFDKIAGAFKSVLEESSNAEIAAKRFANTLQGVGTAADPQRFAALAASLQNVTTFEDDTTIAAGAMLGRFGLAQKQIEGLIPLAQDFAATMGGDLVSAADNVGRAIAQGGRGLESLRLGFGAAQKKAFDLGNENQRVAMLIEKMRQQFGGMSQIMASTATGSMQQFDNALGNLKEAFGKVLDAPVGAAFRKMTEAIRDATTWFDGLSDGTKKAIGVLAASVGTLTAFVAAMASVAGGIGAVQLLFPALQTGFKTVGNAAAAGWVKVLAPLAAVAAGLAGTILLVGAIKTAFKGGLFEGGADSIKSAFTGAFEGLSNSFKATLGPMLNNLVEFVSAAKGQWLEMVDFFQKLWGKFASFLNEDVIMTMGLLRGLSPEETGAIVTESKKSSGGLLDTSALQGEIGKAADAAKEKMKAGLEAGSKAVDSAAAQIKTQLAVGGQVIKDVGTGFAQDLATQFGVGVDALKDLLKSMGIDLSAFSEHTAGGEKATAGRAKDMSVSDEQAKALLEGVPDAKKGGGAHGGRGSLVEAAGGDIDKAMGVVGQLGQMSSVTGEQFQKILAATGGNVDKAMQWAKDFDDIGKATKEGKENARKAIAAGAESSMSRNVKGAAGVLGQGLLNNSGAVGGVISAGMQGMATAGPMGAIAGVAANIMSQSDSFQAVVGKLSAILGTFAQAFNPLFDALGPIISVVGVIAKALGSILGKIMKGLQPVISLITEILIQNLGPIFDVIAMGMQAFAGSLEMLKPILNLVGKVVKGFGQFLRWVFEGLAKFYNGFLDFLAGIFDFLADIPAIGGAFKSIADGLRTSKVDLSQFNKGLGDAADQAEKSADGVAKLQPPLEQVAAALSNVPNILKVTKLRLEASMAEDPRPAGSAVLANTTGMAAQNVTSNNSTDNSRNVHIEKLTVGPGGGQTADTLKRSLESDKFRLTGSTQSSTFPHATPSTAGGY